MTFRIPQRGMGIIDFRVLALRCGRDESSLIRSAAGCWAFARLLAEHQPECGLRFVMEAFLAGVDAGTIQEYVRWKAAHAEATGAV